MHFAQPPAPKTPIEGISTILIELRNAVALHGTILRVFRPLLMLILHRIDSARLRYERLLNRPGPNLPREAQPRPKPRTSRSPKRPPPPVRLPASFGWLRKIIVNTPKSISPLNGIRPVFGQLMTDPTIKFLIAADPGFGRIFRPLCHMLGIHPEPPLRLPHHPAPRPPKPIKRRPPSAPTYPPPPIVIPPDTSVMAYFFPQIYRT